jgi:hypothetical protein
MTPLLVFALAISGEVVSVNGHWTADGSRVVSDVTVRTQTGDVVVSQLGGTADGLTMRVFDDQPLLRPGMLVELQTHDDVDLSLQSHTVLDSVRVDYDPLADESGFVRTGPTKAGHYLFWESGCIFLTADNAGTAAVAGQAEFPIIDASIATWNNDTHTSSCSYIQVEQDPKRAAEVGKDNTNVLKFRDTGCSSCGGHWCRPAIGDDPMRCYNSAAAGITTATYVDDGSSSRDGAIVDADIEINGVDFAISVGGVTSSTVPCHAELQNTLTHELGHLHGLEHTCLAAGDPPRVDDKGNPVPACNGETDPLIVNAVMYPFQDCGETKKETLTTDDSSAICSIYPVAKDPKTCAHVGAPGGCCSAGRDARGSLLLAALVGLLLRVRSRRRLSL